MSVHLKIENSREGLVATIVQRDDERKMIGRPSVRLVASAAEARQLAKTLAQSLGLKVYGVVDKTKSADRPEEPLGTVTEKGAESIAAKDEPPPWLVPGAGSSL